MLFRSRYDDNALRRAIIYGSTMASFVVEDFGPDRLVGLRSEDITQRSRSFHELAAIPQLVPLDEQPA